MESSIISGTWEKIILVNYEVDPAILAHMVPPGTRLNLHRNKCYLTLSGMGFSGIQVKGLSIPFHKYVPQISLRFYVVPENGNPNEKGVVLVKEIVSKSLLALAANLFYKENYVVRPVKQVVTRQSERVRYEWKHRYRNSIQVDAAMPQSHYITPGSEPDFITENPFGYGYDPVMGRTIRYGIVHPQWRITPVLDYEVDVHFKTNYGKPFGFLNNQHPVSVYFVMASSVEFTAPKRLRYEENEVVAFI